MERPQIGLAHQSCDAMLATGLSGLAQIEEDARGAVDAVTRDERRTNEAQQPGVLLSAIRNRLLQPVVVPAWRYLEYAAHRLHAVPVSIRLNELVGRADSPGDLVFGLRHRSSAKSRMLASVHQILGTPRMTDRGLTRDALKVGTRATAVGYAHKTTQDEM